MALFVGWELVGACSLPADRLLVPEAVGRRPPRSRRSSTTRVGDVGLLLGIALLWSARPGRSATSRSSASCRPLCRRPSLTAAALLLLLGAIGKSAQFPLHIWLPDAMEGPTPVSALIHAATMVAAGVFLVARMWPLFEAAPAARTVVLAIGAFTALGAATIAVAQTDIKKVLAYSTISQLGFMFAALGVGRVGARRSSTW